MSPIVGDMVAGPDMVDVFRALDDETRRAVLDELSVRDGQTLLEINPAPLAQITGQESTGKRTEQ